MCIVMFQWNPNGDPLLVVGANREESTNRPMTDPMRISSGFTDTIIAGADHGIDGSSLVTGTWLGVNKEGMVVAVTNRDDGVLHGEDIKNSRGLLCVELIGQPSHVAAIEHAVGNLQKGRYGGCNYIIIDRDDAWIVSAPGPNKVRAYRLKPGLHCITNLDMDDPNDERVQYVHKATSGLEKIDAYEFQELCCAEEIVVKDPDWATICSSIIAVGPKKGTTTFWNCRKRPPRQWSYDSFSYLGQGF